MRRWTGLLTLACVGSLLGCAGETAKPAPPTPPPPPTAVSQTHESPGRVEKHTVVTVTAVVTAVDHAKREVTLRGPKGHVSTVVVGDEVRNFDQVKKGDHVGVRYYEAVAVEIKKPEANLETKTTHSAARVAAGDKPGGMGAHTVTVTAKITKVDKPNKQVTLRTSDGKSSIVDVDEPRYLEKVKKGDVVEITYTEAIAVSVEEAPKKHAK